MGAGDTPGWLRAPNKPADPIAPPVPSASPVSLEAHFEAGGTRSGQELLDKKKRGKSSLTVKRAGTKVASTSGSGLTVSK